MDSDLIQFILGKIRVDYAGISDVCFCKICKDFVITCDYENNICSNCSEKICLDCVENENIVKCLRHDNNFCKQCVSKGITLAECRYCF